MAENSENDAQEVTGIIDTYKCNMIKHVEESLCATDEGAATYKNNEAFILRLIDECAWSATMTLLAGAMKQVTQYVYHFCAEYRIATGFTRVTGLAHRTNKIVTIDDYTILKKDIWVENGAIDIPLDSIEITSLSFLHELEVWQ